MHAIHFEDATGNFDSRQLQNIQNMTNDVDNIYLYNNDDNEAHQKNREWGLLKYVKDDYAKGHIAMQMVLCQDRHNLELSLWLSHRFGRQ